MFGIVPDWHKENQEDCNHNHATSMKRSSRLSFTKEKIIYDKLRKEFWH